MRGSLLALALALVAASGCGGGSGSTCAPVIVDTDLSSDDVIALPYVAQDVQVDLRAVTVSGTGLVHRPAGARIVLDLLAVAGRPDVAVVCGAELPLDGSHAVPEDWRRAADGLFGLTLPRAPRDLEPDAVDLLRTAIEDAPREPIVLSGAPVTLVPLDATNQVPVTAFLARALARYHYATPEAPLASEIVAATSMGAGGSYLRDPPAAVAATRPGNVRTASRRIDVTAGGRTITAAGGPAVEVVTSVHRSAFERELLGTLLGGAPFTIPPHRVQAP